MDNLLHGRTAKFGLLYAIGYFRLIQEPKSRVEAERTVYISAVFTEENEDLVSKLRLYSFVLA